MIYGYKKKQQYPTHFFMQISPTQAIKSESTTPHIPIVMRATALIILNNFICYIFKRKGIYDYLTDQY